MSRKEVLQEFDRQRAATDARVADGIERFRKGDLVLQFYDQSMQPVTDVRVQAEQVDHDFNFGANLFMLDEFNTPAQNAHYRDTFRQVFNAATLPFYWCDLEPEQGKPRFAADSPRVYRRPAPDLCLEYCEANGIRPKAHCLNYDVWTPLWVPQEVGAVKRLLDKRMAELASRYRDRIHGWEVTNELLCGHYSQLRENRQATPFFWERDNMEWSFETARRHFPMNELIANEAAGIWVGFHGDRSPYYMELERALLKGAPIDTIGFQFHIFAHREKEDEMVKTMYNPQHIWQVLDRYGDFGKPMQITEITIPAYSTDPEDEAIQAQMLRELYRIWFASEHMESIIYWNMIDGYAAFAPQGDMTAGENYLYGGLLRFDGSPKPAFYALHDLIHKEWHTSASAETTDGTVSLRAFYGTYRLTVTANGRTSVQTVHFGKDGGAVRVVLDGE